MKPSRINIFKKYLLTVFTEDMLKIFAAGLGGGFVLLIIQLLPVVKNYLDTQITISYLSVLAIILFSILIGSLIIYNIYQHKLDQLKTLSSTDDLTGLYNMRKLKSILRYEVQRSVRYRQPLSIVLIDIDNFKLINDTYMYKQGNLILEEIGLLIQQCIRNTDFAFRYLEGDEFAIVLPDTNAYNARTMAERLRSQIFEHGFHKQNSHEVISLTISGGVTGFKFDDYDKEHKINNCTIDSFKTNAENQLKLAKVTKNAIKLDTLFDSECSSKTSDNNDLDVGITN